MRWLSEAFGPDQLIGMVYYGQGIGRYFAGNTSGQDALSNLGLPGDHQLQSEPAADLRRDCGLPPLLDDAAAQQCLIRLFARGLPVLRAELHAGLGVGPGVEPRHAAGLRQPDLESRSRTVRDGVFGSGWLDVGAEYVFTRRDLFGGSTAAGTAGSGLGIANRILAAAVARF